MILARFEKANESLRECFSLTTSYVYAGDF